MIKNVKPAELKINIETIFLNAQTLQMIYDDIANLFTNKDDLI